MTLCAYVHTVGVLAVERKICNKIIVFNYNSSAVILLVLKHIAVKAAMRFIKMLLARIHFKLQLLRNYGIAVNLTVRMRHCYADNLSPVLEYKYVLDFRIGAYLNKSLRPKVNKLPYMRNGKLRQRYRMLGRIEYNLALAVGGLCLKQSCFNIVRLGRIL